MNPSNSAITTMLSQDSINLISAMIGFIGALIGATIGGLVTYKYSRKQVKENMQISACETVLSKLNDCNNSLFESYSDMGSIVSDIQDYQIAKECEDDSDINLTRFVTDKIEAGVISYENNWKKFVTNYQSFSDFFQSKEVVLHSLVNIYNYIDLETTKIKETQIIFYSIYKADIHPLICKHSYITNSELYSFLPSWDELDDVYCDLFSHFTDFKIELQNHYFSKLFDNYKIMKREAKSDNDIVLSVDKCKPFNY